MSTGAAVSGRWSAGRIGALLGLVATLAAALLWLPVARWSLELVDWIRGAGAVGVGVYALAYVVATALLLPGSLLTLAAGFAYGPLVGTLLVSPISVLAAAVSFGLARSIARDAVARRLAREPRFAAIDAGVAERGFQIVTLLRLSPVLPFNLLNYALGLSRVSLRDYLLGSSLGMLPGTVLYVYLGSLVTSASELIRGERPDGGLWTSVLYWGGLLATVAVTVVVSKEAKRALATHLKRDVPAEPSAAPPPDAPVVVLPEDAHNRVLVGQVHPADWRNPTPAGRYNLVVIGGGTAGLVSAMGAAGLGARVALVERHLLGGDCLNYGCVPSKALIRAARAAYDARRAGAFGATLQGSIDVDFPAVMERMRRLRAGIAQHDSARRFADSGIDVYLGSARFVANDAIEVRGARLDFSRAVIATGARAASAAIPGLAEAGYLTNESIFALTTLPQRLAVIGAGPVGCELAQAFRRFGSEVTVLSHDAQLLVREDPDAAAVLQAQLLAEGVTLVLSAHVTTVAVTDNAKQLTFDRGRGPERVEVDEILVAVGRAPNVEGLGLDLAGVAHDTRGVHVDDRLRTTNGRVFAAGDICSQYKLTHAADAMARVVIQNALFMGRKRVSTLVIPWSTYTDPEIAQVGVNTREAEARGREVSTFSVPLSDNDRAILDGDEAGFARIHVDRRSSRIVGATIVARHAGELIGELALAVTEKLSAGALSRTIHPYPTQSEVWKRLGDAHARTRLKPSIKRLLERYLGWRR